MMENVDNLLVACRIINILLIVTCSWTSFCLVTYGIKAGKWKKRLTSSGTDGKYLYSFCTVASFMTIPRLVLSHMLFLVSEMEYKDQPQLCENLMDTTTVLYFFAIMLVYTFLWLKQRVLYSHEAVQILTGTRVIKISWVICSVILVASTATCCVFAIPHEYITRERGCFLIQVNTTEQQISSDVAYYAGFAAALFAQLSLLGLFIYPLVLNTATQRNRQNQERETTLVSTESCCSRMMSSIASLVCGKDQSNDSLMKAISHSAISTAVAIVSDLAAMAIVAFWIPRSYPRAISNVPYDTGLMVNVLCIVATFLDAKQILLVMCNYKPRQAEEINMSDRRISESTHISTLTPL